jgi:hypothetical protein
MQPQGLRHDTAFSAHRMLLQFEVNGKWGSGYQIGKPVKFPFK